MGATPPRPRAGLARRRRSKNPDPCSAVGLTNFSCIGTVRNSRKAASASSSCRSFLSSRGPAARRTASGRSSSSDSSGRLRATRAASLKRAAGRPGNARIGGRTSWQESVPPPHPRHYGCPYSLPVLPGGYRPQVLLVKLRPIAGVIRMGRGRSNPSRSGSRVSLRIGPRRRSSTDGRPQNQ